MDFVSKFERQVDKTFRIIFRILAIKWLLCLILFIVVQQLRLASNQTLLTERIRVYISELLPDLGCVGRGIGVVGIIAIGFPHTYMAIYSLAHESCRYRLIEASRSGFAQFLLNYEEGKQELNRNIDNAIDKLRESNRLYRQLLARYGSVNGYHRAARVVTELERWGCEIADTKSSNHLRSSIDGRRFTLGNLTAFKDQFEVDDDEFISQLESRLEQQDKHLLAILSDKRSIWPTNRDKKSHRIGAYIWYFAALGLVIPAWPACMFTVIWMTHMAKSALEDESAYQVPKELRQFSQAELIDIFWTFPKSVYMFLAFVEPSAYVAADFFDMWLQASWINRKLIGLDSSVSKIHQNFTQDQTILDRKQELKCLDNEALDTYISLKVVLDEMRPAFVRTSHFLVVSSAVISIATLTTLCFLVILKESVYIMLIVTAALSAFNAYLLAMAFINRKFTNCTKLIWSMIANVESFNGNSDFSGPQADNEEDNCSPIIVRNFYRCPITQHTMTLWRRLMIDADLLSDRFSCQLTLVGRLDYSFLFQFNYVVCTLALFLNNVFL